MKRAKGDSILQKIIFKTAVPASFYRPFFKFSSTCECDCLTQFLRCIFKHVNWNISLFSEVAYLFSRQIVRISSQFMSVWKPICVSVKTNAIVFIRFFKMKIAISVGKTPIYCHSFSNLSGSEYFTHATEKCKQTTDLKEKDILWKPFFVVATKIICKRLLRKEKKYGSGKSLTFSLCSNSSQICPRESLSPVWKIGLFSK